MRVLALVLSAALITTGCAKPRTLRYGGIGLMALGGGTAAMAGMLCLPYAFPAPQDEDPDKDNNLRGCRNVAIVGAVVFAIGLPLLLYGHAGAAREEREERARRADEDFEKTKQVVEQYRATRVLLAGAMNDAVNAARAGNCELVGTQARYVLSVDPQYFTHVFLRDPSIHSCHPKTGDPDRDREQAFALIKLATSAAASGDCTVAVGLDAKIRELDEHVYNGWFVTDASIKACLSR